MTTESKTTALYRFFDASDSLLYVGITHRLNGRLSAHKRTKPWHEVARVELEHYPTRELAANAEINAIKHEQPVWNVQYADNNGSQSNGWAKKPYEDLSDPEMLVRYWRFKVWSDLDRFYPDMCSDCHGYADDDLNGGTLAELMKASFGRVVRLERDQGWIVIHYHCPTCGSAWKCGFSDDFPLVLGGAEPAVVSWVLTLFPPGTSWDRNDVWMTP